MQGRSIQSENVTTFEIVSSLSAEKAKLVSGVVTCRSSSRFRTVGPKVIPCFVAVSTDDGTDPDASGSGVSMVSARGAEGKVGGGANTSISDPLNNGRGSVNRWWDESVNVDRVMACSRFI